MGGTKLVKIECCKYRVTTEQITDWLKLYGELASEIKEETYILEDEDEDGELVISPLISFHDKKYILRHRIL